MNILNRHHLTTPWPPGAVYVGRGTPLGNPYPVDETRTREEAVTLYRRWLFERLDQRDPVVIVALAGLHEDSQLVCSCAPKLCHAEVIREVWQKYFKDGFGLRPRSHADGSLPAHGEVFVFGSNRVGRHGKGAAKAAEDLFGAVRGVGEGYMGEPPAHCYAIPTKDEALKTLALGDIIAGVQRFREHVLAHPERHYFLTRVGCGLAGYEDARIAPLFSGLPPHRVSVPVPWLPHVAPRSLRYAGIGSRRAPAKVLNTMREVARRLAKRGYVLRSGGAEGADTAFAEGAEGREIFLPWPGFNGVREGMSTLKPEAFAIAEQVHPAYKGLSETVRKLMARNTYQILGYDLRTPVDFVVCWTPDGAESEAERGPETGGTGQAIALASRLGIPVFNMAKPDALRRLGAFLEGHA